jgi:hypothetical protein
MFTSAVIASTAEAAKRYGVEPAALLAVVEVESAGKAYENDGRTPRFLFEQHVFYRELLKRAPDKLPAAVHVGLARKSWDRAVQYKEQGTSKDRMDVLRRARAIDAECANLSASWGVGQTMGFHYKALGFASATAMVQHMTTGGLAAQIDVMCRNISDMGMWPALKVKNFAAFARRYNGAGYKQNAYDTKMAAAYSRWTAKLANGIPKDAPAKAPAGKAAKVLIPAAGSAATAAQQGWSATSIILITILTMAVIGGGLVWWRIRKRKRAERPQIPAIAR